MRSTNIWTTSTGMAALVVLAATPALAQLASERTTIKISEAVMVPDATLQPGTYVFELKDFGSDIVQISKEGGEIVATTMTIPLKRMEARDDTVLKFNPTESGTPALKGWFYPGSLFGHQFIYSDEQAKQIAERTRTVVLTQDVKGSDTQRGRIYVYDPKGQRTPYTEDPNVRREWSEWRKSQRGQSPNAVVTSPPGEKRASAVPMIAAGAEGTRVNLGDLEDNAKQYMGKTISVDAHVDEVLGPRVFKIDEGYWLNLGGEMLVVMPTHLAALVDEDDRVTVSGTVKQFVRADIEREWGFLGLTDAIEIELRTRPVLVASRVVGGDNNVALMIESGKPNAGATGQGGSGQQVTNLSELATADHDFIGRNVRIADVRIDKPAKGGGFWTRSGNTSILVLPVDTAQRMTAGQSVSVDGVVLQMPRHMRQDLDPGADWNDQVYIYGTKVGEK